MEYRIKLEANHFSGASEIILTTDRAESSYGIPVAVLVGGPNSGMAFGPADSIPHADMSDPLSWLSETAALTVAAAEAAARRADGRAAIWGEGCKPELIKEAATHDELYERFFGNDA